MPDGYMNVLKALGGKDKNQHVLKLDPEKEKEAGLLRVIKAACDEKGFAPEELVGLAVAWMRAKRFKTKSDQGLKNGAKASTACPAEGIFALTGTAAKMVNDMIRISQGGAEAIIKMAIRSYIRDGLGLCSTEEEAHRC